MLNSSGESGHPCLVPDFKGNAFNFSPLRIMFAEGLSYITFIMLRYVPSIPAFWISFYHKCMFKKKTIYCKCEWQAWIGGEFQQITANYIKKQNGNARKWKYNVRDEGFL